MNSRELHPRRWSLVTCTPFLWFGLVIAAAGLWSSHWPGHYLETNYVDTNPSVHAAAFWTRACHGVQCRLCPRNCFLPENLRGWCRVRINLNQKLYTQVYGLPASIHVDPIEKKPVFHLLPGSTAFSLATAGCNLGCLFCQNWTLSTANPEELPTQYLSPQAIVSLARETHSRSIAYTYSEPVIFYEYMLDIARLAHDQGLYNVMISGGYISERPLRQLLPWMDVIKVDLKGNDENFYRRVVNGELQYVRRTLKIIAASGTQLEVVNLVIPTQNDAPDQIAALCQWLVKELGPETPVFFSRFSPMHLMPNLPITPVETLLQARRLAHAAGLQYVYLGNVMEPEVEDTVCPHCGLKLVGREGYAIVFNRLAGRETCPRCGQHIPGIWNDTRARNPIPENLKRQ